MDQVGAPLLLYSRKNDLQISFIPFALSCRGAPQGGPNLDVILFSGLYLYINLWGYSNMRGGGKERNVFNRTRVYR
jgi:hypothetical protein